MSLTRLAGFIGLAQIVVFEAADEPPVRGAIQPGNQEKIDDPTDEQQPQGENRMKNQRVALIGLP